VVDAARIFLIVQIKPILRSFAIPLRRPETSRWSCSEVLRTLERQDETEKDPKGQRLLSTERGDHLLGVISQQLGATAPLRIAADNRDR
ncbi:MAG TPA: hypothetical protein VFE09_04040, partial [Rubrobacteraceae bacterium]|nr:hypothetical protein [Rubrobacteraceae bacterium]